MKLITTLFGVGLLCISLSSCAGIGTDFVRPDSATFKNGRTTYGEVIDRFGAPRSEGTLLKNERTVKAISYAYAQSLGGKPYRDGVIPVRAMSFYFLDNILVGHSFVSSWADDHTHFDETKTAKISKGKSTRWEVISLLGNPSGNYTYPMIKPREGDALVYSYTEMAGSAFTGIRPHTKVLTVTFDEKDVVSDIEFVSAGSN